MIRWIINFFSTTLLLFWNSSYGQTSTDLIDTTITDTTKSVYKNLEIKTFSYYIIPLATEYNRPQRKIIYKVNGKVVNKSTFDMANKENEGNWKNINTCKPCLMLTYDDKDKLVLIRKAIQYMDCFIGFYIEYYPSGKVKIVGHYLENNTEKWSIRFITKKFCKRDGVWLYYDESGRMTKIEKYKNGELIK